MMAAHSAIHLAAVGRSFGKVSMMEIESVVHSAERTKLYLLKEETSVSLSFLASQCLF